jgi:hypothetical protein
MQCIDLQLLDANNNRPPGEVGACACPPVRPRADRFYAAVGLRLAALPLRRFHTDATPPPRAVHKTRPLITAESAAPAAS